MKTEAGVQDEVQFFVSGCSLGCVLVAVTGRGVCAIALGDTPDTLVHDLKKRCAGPVNSGVGSSIEQLAEQVADLVESPWKEINFPLDIQGSAFQRHVWRALTRIPPGRTMSYTEVARNIGAPHSARAVANACGANPIAVVIPCHRVIRSNGTLSGYRGGVERKRELLSREKIWRESLNQ